ncbi:MAG: TauD/TfdA family dioxygenase [Alphaproteobacteria bacterium]|nr:TauD/TfdA family dioxygenase [Alphaproteobacteria bacterium]MBN9558591.1 TauD/TfdA family dioxygenase [Alphaproteobacteria bacterium]MBN9593575.1 TauD/TfdA family dioxygenase [Alphaproteobacteria bacterium]
MTTGVAPERLETHIAWQAKDVADPESWTMRLSPEDRRELDAALAHAKTVSRDLLDIGLEDFPLDGLAEKLSAIERELIDGRGFVRISALDTARYDDDELTMLYWGIGLHLGDPWPQNAKGHLMGDVTDQGKALTDPTFRGNELGQIALDYHTDGADLIGLMCLRKAHTGGLSCVANVVAIYNEMVATRPDLVAALYEALPYDFRGEQRAGTKPFYEFPVFTAHAGRLFVRFIPAYIRASQRHADAPRLSPRAEEALDMVSTMARDPRNNVYMDLQPGEMQFINNYHVLHGRTAYEDSAEAGEKRHLKRLWLATRYLKDRPPHFRRQENSHWAARRTASHIAAVARPH